MRQSFWDKRFPTVLGLLLIGIGTMALTYVTRSPQLFELGATTPLEFEDIRVSNQTATSLSISFRTKEPVAAQLRFGRDLATVSTVFDERDEIGKEPGAYRTHHFTVQDLTASQRYVFAIVAKGQTFDNQGAGFSVKTASFASVPEALEVEPVRGTVVTGSGLEAQDALIIITIEGATSLSTVSKAQGAFLVPLGNVHTSDLTSLYTFTGNEVLSIEVFGNDGEQAQVVVPLGKLRTLPPIRLGKNTDLTQEEEVSETSGFTTEATTQTNQEEAILTPKDGDFVVDERPLFQGKGVPSARVEITIQSALQEATLTVNNNGQWSWQPKEPLPPGKHTVSARFFSGDRITKVIRHEFEVFASGSQVAELATPSPTIKLSQPPTPLPTAPPIPTTGTALPAITILGAGFILTVVGILALHRAA